MKDDGGPAFPRPIGVTHGGIDAHQYFNPEQVGMTLRDWFAGKAMLGLLSSCSDDGVMVTELAIDAYEIADSMIEEKQDSNE